MGPQADDWAAAADQRLAHEIYARALHRHDLAQRLRLLSRDARDTIARALDATWVGLPAPARDVAEILLALATGLNRAALLDEDIDPDRLFQGVALRLLTDGLRASGAALRSE
jgi:hypothetical protein